MKKARDQVPRLLAALALALAAPAAAQAYTLGHLDPHADSATSCGNVGTLYVDDEVPSDAPGPAGRPRGLIPPGGGTITSFATGVHPKGLRVRLALVRPVGMRGNGVVVEHRSRVVKIPADHGYSAFRTHLKAEEGELIALDVLDQYEIPMACFFGVKRDDFVWVANDQRTRGRIHDYLAGDGYDHSRVDLRAHLVRRHH